MPTAKPKSKNDTWSEKELTKVLKQTDVSGKPLEKDKTSKSASSGTSSKEKGSSKSSSKDKSDQQKVSSKDKEKKDKTKPPTGGNSKASPFTDAIPGGTKEKTSTSDRGAREKHSEGRKQKDLSSESKGDSKSSSERKIDKRDKKHTKRDEKRDEQGLSKERSEKGDRKSGKGDKEASKDSLSSGKRKSERTREHKKSERRREEKEEARDSHRRREKGGSDAKLSSSKRSLKEGSSKNLSTVGSIVTTSSIGADSGDNISSGGSQIRVLEHPPSTESGEDDEDSGDFVTDRHKHKQSLAGHTLQHMVEITGEGSEDVPVEENYEDDDFEDYDDDFEDEPGGGEDKSDQQDEDNQDSEGGLEQFGELAVAIDAENRRLSSPGWMDQNKQRGAEETEETLAEDGPHQKTAWSPRHRVFLDFSSVKSVRTDRETVRKMKTRGKDLLDMIEFDIVSFDMLDLPPVSEYEVYMRSFGQNDCSQVALQTGEDMVDVDAQTEDIVLRGVWTQHPQEGATAVGGDVCVDGSESTSEADILTSNVDVLSVKDTSQLSAFLTKATQVISILLEEEYPLDNQQGSTHQQQQGKSSLNFSVNYTKLASTYSYLGGRHWKDIVFSPSTNNILLMTLSSPSSPSWTGVNSKGILCLWNTRDPSRPYRVLVTEGSPMCCLLSQAKNSLAFAGMEDGSVEVWDLRMSPSRGLLGEEVDWPGLYPAYSTAGVVGVEGHVAPIKCMCMVNVPQDVRSSVSYFDFSDSGGSLGLSFQVATLDVSGRLVIWVIAELSNPDPHGSETDFGVAPGGEVKLIKSASADICDQNVRSVGVSSIMRVHCMTFHPRDINHYYVGTDMGSVLHCQRYGKRPIPKLYQKDSDHSTDVTAIVFSPWQPDHFLVGCGDGSISLYHNKKESPLVSWTRSTRGRGVQQIIWSHHRPGVFVVLDEASTVHLWDLLECDAAPVNKAEAQNMKIARISLSPQVRDANKQRSLLVLSFEDGSVEIHQFSEQYTVLKENEQELFSEYLFSLVM